MTKYQGAQILATQAHGTKTESLVRFEGGVPVWVLRAAPGIIGRMPGVNRTRVSKVRYGTVPDAFQQTTPDSGPPEPLEPDRFYVFTVNRASGASDFDVVKVMADGTLVVYSARPRAGSSYLLCCNLDPNFAAVGSASPAPEQGLPNDP